MRLPRGGQFVGRSANDFGAFLEVRLQNAVDDFGELRYDERFGFGRINATKAVTLACQNI